MCMVMENAEYSAKRLVHFLLIISIIALDLYTKFVVSGDNNTIIVSSFIKLHTINNYGIAFSLLMAYKMAVACC